MSDSPEENAVSAIHIHAPRHYQTFPGSKYVLPHDDLERQRQHNMLKSIFEDRILLAPVSLAKSDKVLEIGTGPGLWIMDLATTVDSSVPMVGTDIEPRLFPTSPPKNIEFRVASVTSLPSEWTGLFSLAIQEIHRVLRPGGWVQLAETAGWKGREHVEYPGRPCLEKLAAMYQRLAESRNFDLDCAFHIPQMLADAGFVDIQSESRMQVLGKWAEEIGVACATNQVGVFRGMKTPVLEAGGFGYVTSEAEYDELLNGLEKEWEDISGTQREFIVTLARKPLA
ncbi:hypothetical protein K438DRAFT_1964115 [Mycena galopus ATCC 62051]|nr:hypothetical protein K438DRAFT_1964115 [Mycena galopus ATCC 62051]